MQFGRQPRSVPDFGDFHASAPLGPLNVVVIDLPRRMLTIV